MQNPRSLRLATPAQVVQTRFLPKLSLQPAGIKIESIPFQGSSKARTACIGGHIDAMVASPAEAKAASDAGQMTPLFVMEDKRIDLFPDNPNCS